MLPRQTPIDSGFGARSTADEVLAGRRLEGVTAIVTGGYSGLGLETTRALARAGATLVVPARSPDKARRNLDGVPGVELGALDLLDPASIDAFASSVLASGRALDLLVNSAGVMAPPLERDARGYESQFSANHLGHFRLAARLWPALRRSGRARVVSVSSRGHMRGNIDFEDPNFERRPYDKWAGYGQSKTANVLFAVELDRRGQGQGVRAFSLHPGTIVTDLARHLGPAELEAMGVPYDEAGRPKLEEFAQSAGGKTPEQGAATSVWCATSPQIEGQGGVYCEDCDVAELAPDESQRARGVRPYAVDPEAAGRLWALSERLNDLRFEA